MYWIEKWQDDQTTEGTVGESQNIYTGCLFAQGSKRAKNCFANKEVLSGCIVCKFNNRLASACGMLR